MKKTYHGSCHCGEVSYETALDLQAGTFRCNCSVCRKKRSWLAVASPEEVPLPDASWGPPSLHAVPPKLHHLFGRNCGVSSYAWGENEALGTFFAVAVNCLDDATADELIAAPIA